MVGGKIGPKLLWVVREFKNPLQSLEHGLKIEIGTDDIWAVP
jgi:hypothetical protein